jgi:Icc-related predicted phosphoesterase
MKIVCVSDTHGRHRNIKIPECDILIHAGDIGLELFPEHLRILMDFTDWMNESPASLKVCIAGNHDFILEKPWIEPKSVFDKRGIHYLMDNYVVFENLKIYGSPWQPYFHNWAFNIESEEKRGLYWSKIPDDTDILVTHSPPYGILDKNFSMQNLGCKALLKRIKEISPLISVFGHVHEGRGLLQQENTLFVNACNYDTVEPILLEI